MNSISLVMVAVIVVLALGYFRAPACACPYRRRMFLTKARHDSTTRMTIMAMVWVSLLIHDLAVYPYPGTPVWARAYDGLATALACYLVGWYLLRVYYHEYPAVRRLRRRLIHG